MSIRKPKEAPPPFTPLAPDALPDVVCTRTYAVTLVTPLYGGGVQAGVPDKDMPVRVSSIRGQLRFWWRLLNGRGKSPEQLFIEERALWGGLGDTPEQVTASRVRLKIGQLKTLKHEQCADYLKDQKKNDGSFKSTPKFRGSLSQYVLFSAQGELSDDRKEILEQPAELLQPGATFKLSVELLHGSTEEFDRILMLALRFWASFGGLGARTRRGLGSIKIHGLSPVTPQEAQQYGCRLVLKIGGKPQDPIEQWAFAIGKLKTFRQEPGFARNGNRLNPGRSRWPEPDAIRRMTDVNSSRHPPQHQAGKLFPRALFGLPIIFHFKDEVKSDNKRKADGDPRQTSLVAKGSERFASPLILKAYWDGTGFQSAALLLPTVEDLRTRVLTLTYTGENHPIGELASGNWWPVDAKKIKAACKLIQPLQNSSGDPLDAFLAFFVKD